MGSKESKVNLSVVAEEILNKFVLMSLSPWPSAFRRADVTVDVKKKANV